MRRRVDSPTSTAPGDIPAELLDRWHPVWDSLKLTTLWFQQHDLPTSEKLKYGPANRLYVATSEWMRKAGMVRSLPSGYVVIDGERGRALGLHFYGGARQNHERLEYAGVITFPNDPPHRRPE